MPVSVRVGQAVDVVGQAGRPKTITGFATHTTPVLLAYEQVLALLLLLVHIWRESIAVFDRGQNWQQINIFHLHPSWKDS